MPRTSERHGLAARRASIAAGIGLAVLVAGLAAGANWAVAVTGAWGAAGLTIIVAVWLRIHRMDASETRAHAQAEDFSRPMADLAILSACAASLVAIGFTLLRAGNHSGTDKALLILLALVVVAVSWATVHTVYTVTYGDIYYGSPVGGVDFNKDEAPDYRDFAYLAFTIGMTYQVSDTSLTEKRLRRVALRHAMLSFVFGTVILALAINTAASLLK